ncbi:ethylene-responsive protein kinase Le-CTR1-domain-containing protein [Zopfochytrium polystomum]|nr:ethylene-responsive protein kinase Le-CTR1-domain-containing protein [Zopfochytrium polystomum]
MATTDALDAEMAGAAVAYASSSGGEQGGAERPAPFFDGLLIPGSPLSPSARLGSPQQAQQQQQPQQASPPPPRPPPPVPSPGYTVKRACQPSDRRAPNNAVQRFYSIERDDIGLTEFRLRSVSDVPRIGACALCDPENWTFHGSQYDPFLTLLYAERDGCIPSSVVTTYPKFIVPWRYKNKRTGEITWKIFHLSGDKITSADSETIIVNPSKDLRLRRVMRRAAVIKSKFQGQDVERVEYLLRIVRETLGDYGLPGGPSSAEADARLFQQMLNQGHNLMLLCDVEIGLCRHKALLFKILCDVIDLNCALVTGYSTAGRHQWNIITIPNKGNFLIDPTSPHFTWTTKGSHRTRGYRVTADTSFGHSGFTQKEAGIF